MAISNRRYKHVVPPNTGAAFFAFSIHISFGISGYYFSRTPWMFRRRCEPTVSPARKRSERISGLRTYPITQQLVSRQPRKLVTLQTPASILNTLTPPYTMGFECGARSQNVQSHEEIHDYGRRAASSPELPDSIPRFFCLTALVELTDN